MNQLGGNRETVQNKLIIMYITRNLNAVVTNNNITKLILEARLMNYFVLQQCINDLLDSKLISINPKGDDSYEAESYSITNLGDKTLDYFLNLIPLGIKKRIDRMLVDSGKEFRLKSQVTADFMPESEDKYNVTCRIGEKTFQMIELNVAVGTKKDARAVCDNWINHSSEIYAEIIESLTKKRDK